MTRPKSKRQDFGALLGRVFHIKLSLSKSMLFGADYSFKITACI